MILTSSKQNEAARDEILASIRRNLKMSEPFDAVHREHKGHSVVTDAIVPVRKLESQNSLIEMFTQNLEMVGGHVTPVKDESEAANCVVSVIKGIGANKIAVSGSDLVGRIVGKIEDKDFIENADVETLFDCHLGITSAQWAIAETGTLVLESETENHRLTSLVPAVHLCIFRASQIRQTLGEILELTGKNMSRTITFITGASRTSDIELTLAIGVHGPGELHVIVIDDQ